MAIAARKLIKRWMKEPGFKDGYDALAEEFDLASILIEARVHANLSQTELARRMKTSQSAVARLESGSGKPSLTTLRRFAQATGRVLKITLEPPQRSKKKGSRRAAA